MTRRQRAVHVAGLGETALCGTTRARVLKLSQDNGAVTCKRCVYRLLDRGDIAKTDPRVTESMRQYRIDRGLE